MNEDKHHNHTNILNKRAQHLRIVMQKQTPRLVNKQQATYYCNNQTLHELLPYIAMWAKCLINKQNHKEYSSMHIKHRCIHLKPFLHLFKLFQYILVLHRIMLIPSFLLIIHKKLPNIKGLGFTYCLILNQIKYFFWRYSQELRIPEFLFEFFFKDNELLLFFGEKSNISWFVYVLKANYMELFVRFWERACGVD